MRADIFLSALFEGRYSRSQIQKGFAEGQVRVFSQKSNTWKTLGKYYPLRGDRVEMDIRPIPSTLPPDHRPLEIIFENSDFLVVSKDAGINTHPTPGYEGKFGTLVNQLIAQITDFERESGEERPGIVHRIDKETSGLLLVAKNDRTLRKLQKLIHDHEVKKTYLALVMGIPTNHEGTIKSLIGRDPNNRTQMTVKNPIEPREAITHYKTINSFNAPLIKGGRGNLQVLSLLEVTLETGRTHQIRVHMANIGHPIVGDKTYGDNYCNTDASRYFGLNRQFLHAWNLRFIMDDVQYDFTAPLKSDLMKTLDVLER